jgi:hypothetical protein
MICFADGTASTQTHRLEVPRGGDQASAPEARNLTGCPCREAGVHPNVIGRLERGIYNPTVLTLDAIAAALNTSIVDLLRGAIK